MKKKINLYCLPFAGGNKYSYREFVEKAPSFLNIIPLEYPGRGAKIKEPLLSDINALADNLYNQISNEIGNNNYGLYGHSMGGLMSYLLTLKILENNKQAPSHLFITGTTGPSAPSRQEEKKRYLLDKKEFIEEIKELDGMPEEILQNEELLYYFEPILRSDFKLSENYMYQDHAPLNIPITVITGTDEDMELEDVQLWQKETTFKVDFKKMPGKHFFIFKHTQIVVDIISKKLFVQTKAHHYE
jgi:surfactin synthase thioesterase subunit